MQKHPDTPKHTKGRWKKRGYFFKKKKQNFLGEAKIFLSYFYKGSKDLEGPAELLGPLGNAGLGITGLSLMLSTPRFIVSLCLLLGNVDEAFSTVLVSYQF